MVVVFVQHKKICSTFLPQQSVVYAIVSWHNLFSLCVVLCCVFSPLLGVRLSVHTAVVRVRSFASLFFSAKLYYTSKDFHNFCFFWFDFVVIILICSCCCLPLLIDCPNFVEWVSVCILLYIDNLTLCGIPYPEYTVYSNSSYVYFVFSISIAALKNIKN